MPILTKRTRARDAIFFFQTIQFASFISRDGLSRCRDLVRKKPLGKVAGDGFEVNKTRFDDALRNSVDFVDVECIRRANARYAVTAYDATYFFLDRDSMSRFPCADWSIIPLFQNHSFISRYERKSISVAWNWKEGRKGEEKRRNYFSFLSIRHRIAFQ